MRIFYIDYELYRIRSYIASPKDDKQELNPKQKALSIIDSLPGNSILTKTGYITVGAGLATLVISKELYVANEETLMVIAFAGMTTAVYRMARQPFNEWAAEQMNRVNNILDQAQEDHKSAVKERIDTVSQLRDIVDVTKTLFAISKETAKVEAEAFELKQKVAVATEIKSVLDSWVRYEASLREQERKALASYIIDHVRTQLEDSTLQQKILNQSIIDLERIIDSKSV